MLGGPGVERAVADARQRLERLGLAGRFTLLDREIPLSECAEWMSITDIGVSLMRVPDMRSSSILQAAAAGAALVVNEQAEYRAMTEAGFRAEFVKGTDAESVANAISRLIDDPDRRREMKAANDGYLREHEDATRQMEGLLAAIERAVSIRAESIQVGSGSTG